MGKGRIRRIDSGNSDFPADLADGGLRRDEVLAVLHLREVLDPALGARVVERLLVGRARVVFPRLAVVLGVVDAAPVVVARGVALFAALVEFAHCVCIEREERKWCRVNTEKSECKKERGGFVLMFGNRMARRKPKTGKGGL